jgi:hypothetical protein
MRRGHRKGRFTKENASRLGKLGAAVREERRLKRIAEGWTDTEPQRVPEGKPLGVLTWHATDGTVRRWVVEQGPRANNIGVVARVARGDDERRVMGWDKLLASLRKRLAVPKRVFRG